MNEETGSHIAKILSQVCSNWIFDQVHVGIDNKISGISRAISRLIQSLLSTCSSLAETLSHSTKLEVLQCIIFYNLKRLLLVFLVNTVPLLSSASSK